MNKGIFFMGVLGFLAGAVVAGGFTYGVMNSEALEAEAHAHAAEDRAGACEAKFQKQTVIYSAPPQAGASVLGGLIRIAPGATIEEVTGGANPVPEYVIPAEVTPRAMTAGTNEYFSWVDKSGHVEGPWKIQ